MDPRPSRAQLVRQLERLDRQLALVRAQLLPEPPAPVREPFDAVGVELGAARYAIAAAVVQRVIPLVAWSPLPETPDWVLGLFRFQGQTSMLVDLHRRLHGCRTPLSISMVIVVTKAPEAVGLVVGGVSGVFEVDPEAVTAPPREVSYAPFVTGSLVGAGDDITHLLSLERLRRELVGLELPDLEAGVGP